MLKNQIGLLGLWLLSISVYAQHYTVELGVDGLTCSQCMRSVEIALRKQPGVQSVWVDLQATIAYVEVGREGQLPLLKKAVEEAGFSVRSMSLLFTSATRVTSCMMWGGGCLVWLPEEESDTPLQRVYVAGRTILSKRAYKQWHRRHSLPAQACTECLSNIWYVSKTPYDEPADE
ncbi:heavy-metal-associated domain-containing protein [Thermonema rossianum]|uniref:heavy-metal-associated domain-containing protein n=1 Tax=Thermonema rossianum TaxID=55505 RepID=UPI00068C77D2|nr:heavy metal-associated domain-containing protein [Thermonema rossianum]